MSEFVGSFFYRPVWVMGPVKV